MNAMEDIDIRILSTSINIRLNKMNLVVGCLERFVDSAWFCMYAWMHACMDVCMSAWMHACLPVCLYACMHVCIRLYTCMCVCRCIYAGAQYLHMLPHVFQNHILHYTPNWYHCQFQALDKKCTAKLLRMLQFCGNLQDPVWMLQEVSRPTVTFCSSNVYTDIHSIVDDSPW